MCSFDIREYTDKPKPSFFLHVKPKPDTKTDFLDAIERKEAEISKTTDADTNNKI